MPFDVFILSVLRFLFQEPPQTLGLSLDTCKSALHIQYEIRFDEFGSQRGTEYIFEAIKRQNEIAGPQKSPICIYFVLGKSTVAQKITLQEMVAIADIRKHPPPPSIPIVLLIQKR